MNDAITDFLFGTEPIRRVQQLFGPGHPGPFHLLSLLGDTWGMLFAFGTAYWLFERRTAYALAGVIGLAAGSWIGMSELFDVPRPAGSGIVVHEHVAAGTFPSGHVYIAVCAWGLLYLHGRVRWFVPASIAALVAVGRLYLGTHYVGDIVGGIVFGALFLALYRSVAARFWNRRLPRLPPAAIVGLALLLVAVGLVWLTLVSDDLRRWEVAGLAVGGAIALPVARSRPGGDPAPASRRVRAARLGIGVAGIVAFALLARAARGEPGWVGGLAAGLAVFWTVLAAPALFGRVEPAGRVDRR